MSIKRLGLSNPAADTNTTIAIVTEPHLASVIATNKSDTGPALITIWVVPVGATQESQYSYITYNLELSEGNSFETHRFAMNQSDTLRVKSSTGEVSFIASGVPQTATPSTDSSQIFTNKTISGLTNTLTDIGNESLVNDSITLMGEEMELGETVSNLDYFQFDTSATVTPAVGKMWWNSGEGTVDLEFSSNVTYQMGMQLYMPPTKNNSGVEIPAGSFVMATGAQGDRITIAKAVTNGTVAAEYMIGVAAETIPIGSETGKIITQGTVFNVNTASWPVGTILYPDPANAGQLTSTKPEAPNIKTPVAIVLRQQANTGRILVRMDVASELGGTDTNVLISSPSDGQGLVYESATGLWKNKNVDAFPSQTGNSGKYLTTNGTTTSWGTIDLSSYATTTSLSNHESDTTNIHGISDSSNLVYTSDSRLSDSRTPTSHASSHGSAGSDAITIAQSQVTNLTTDLSSKAPLDSPALTGTPTAPTAAPLTNTTQVATTAFVRTEVSSIIDSAPATLDTLNELAAALGDDPNFATTISTALGGKEPTISSGTTSQYWRGDKTWQTLDKSAVGLGNVENTALSTWAGSSNITTVGTLGSLTVSGLFVNYVQRNIQAASYTLVISDASKLIEMNVGSANNLTVPLNSSVPFPIGTQIDILQTGTGQTTVVATGGVTINATPGLKLRAQWSSATLIKRATDTWVLMGDISV